MLATQDNIGSFFNGKDLAGWVGDPKLWSVENGEIVGVLSLTIYHVPTGLRSIVEDVIVDEKMRRRGIGEALVRSAINLARDAGANGVALTSNPQREAANQLYQSMGFELRKTNPYFYKLK